MTDVSDVRSEAQIAALWAFDKAGRYPPQFVGAVAESLRDAWFEESERIRAEAERWFSEFDDEPEVKDRWVFEVFYSALTVPASDITALPTSSRTP
jgi:hypothetical protein